MKLFSALRIFTALGFSVALASGAFADEPHNKTKNAAPAAFLKAAEAGVSAEWLAQARADYPLDSCVVSDDNLEKNDMGPPQDWIYRQEGKPERLVVLCCNHCVKDFKKTPARYLKLIDEAAAAKAKEAPAK